MLDQTVSEDQPKQVAEPQRDTAAAAALTNVESVAAAGGSDGNSETGKADPRCESYEVHTDTDLLHGDLDTEPEQRLSNMASCCEACTLKASCVGLTLTPSGDCWLKSSAGEPTKQRGLTSAIHVKHGRLPARARDDTASATRAGSRAEEGARVRADAHEQIQQQQRQDAQQQMQRQKKQASSNLLAGAPAGPVVRVRDGCSSDPAVGCMARPAVVVMSHDRPEMTRRCLELLLALPGVERFTVYVSEDAGSKPVRRAAEEFGNRVKEVLSSTPRVGATPFKRGGVSKIAQHFRAAADATLVERGHSHAIFIEDDLLLSPDFLTLFWESAWLLEADPSLWCVSAWNDQGFPHTAQDPHRLLRTDYFPGLGWMVPASVWSELRAKWPEAPTTGWDHWMRLSSTSKGRECVAPEINRSRHASKRGTNVVDNKPFERFTFERTGVASFGDTSYLMRQRHDSALAESMRTATRLSWPGAWGGGKAFESAIGWVNALPSAPAQMLIYRREEYKTIAKALGLWGENQRATHNGTITLRTKSGGTLLLADARKSPYLEPSEKLHPPAGMRQLGATLGESCDAACAKVGGRCDMQTLEWGNNCEAMARHFGCEAGCGHQVGTELPAYAEAADLDTHRQCLISDIAVSECKAAFRKTRRLCSCVM